MLAKSPRLSTLGAFLNVLRQGKEDRQGRPWRLNEEERTLLPHALPGWGFIAPSRTIPLTLSSDASIAPVYSHDVFVHFPALLVYFYLQEFKRVLKPGGLGLISFLHFVTQFEWFKQLSLDYFRQRRVPPHARHYFVTDEMLRTMLADLSLGIREIRSEHYLAVVFQK